MELKMKDLEELAIDLACLISDYKNNANNDKEHVLRWINQFPEEYKKFVLEQTILLMKKSYFSKENYNDIFDDKYMHYGIFSWNHIIDIISAEEPKIAKLENHTEE